MLHKNLIDALSRGGLGRDGDAFTTPSGLTLTVYLRIADEALVVDRVVRVEVGTELATVTTYRKERYVVELDAVAAVRLHPEGNAAGYA
jgi:hypothetical protein